MGKEIRTQQPVKVDELVSGNGGDPLSLNLFRSANKEATTENIPSSPLSHYSFNPHAPEFEYIPNATPSTTNTDYFNNLRQSNWEKAGRSAIQFGANAASSIGQGLANTFDMVALGKTIKGELTGSNDDFNSSLFGLSSKEMQEWSNNVNERNKIFEENPGNFNPGDFSWWANQFSSAGTGVGMAVEALGTTLALESATGGMGTGAALSKLGSLWNKITKGAKGLETMNEAVQVAKGLRSAATLYGTINRYSESRMEAQQNYDAIFEELSKEKDENGNDKFSDEEKKYLSSEGARRTYNLNMALLPLDILGYRTMVFNPVSGSATGLVEKGLEKIGNKWIRKGVQGLVFSGLEGTEEGLQFIAQEEGRHYAKVLGGMDDASSFLNRAAEDVQKDEFWNNFAGGVLGAPIIGGVMNVVNKAISNNNTSRINEIHQDYIKNVGKMDNSISEKIKLLQAEGRTKEASILRRQFGANKALSALHLDAMTDKNTAYDNYTTFLKTTLDEINNNKVDSLTDLGFSNITPEQMSSIKEEFTQYLDDAEVMGKIYDDVKNKYNKNFIPEIAQEQFQLNRLMLEQGKLNQDLTLQANELSQYNSLSEDGKNIYNSEYKLQALKLDNERLTNMFRNVTDPDEKKNIEEVIELNKTKQQAVKESLSTFKAEASDNDIINSALTSDKYLKAMYEKEALDSTVALKRKNLANWNNKEFTERKTIESVAKAKTQQQVENNEAVDNSDKVKEAIEEKKKEVAAKKAAEVVVQQEEAKSNAIPGNANLFADDENLISAIRQDTLNQGDVEDNLLSDEAPPTYLFLPKKIDFNKSSPEAKARVANGVRGLLNKIDDNSFEGLVRHIVKVSGENVADEIFNAIKYGWETVGMPPVDYEAVYNRVFVNPMEELLGGFGELTAQTEEEFKEASEKVTDKVIAVENGPNTFDNNNQPVYAYKGRVTNEASPKMAFTSRLSDLVAKENEDGVVEVSYEYTEDELNTGEYVDSLSLLDPDKFIPGTPLVIRIPTNFLDVKIPIYKSDGFKDRPITFGQYVAENNLSPSDEAYQDKIPMVIYPDNNSTKGVSFVHDIGWYHPLRFNQEKKDDMEKAIANTRRIRKEVLMSSTNSVSAVVTSKRQTTFEGLKSKGQLYSIKEANPQAKLMIAMSTDSLTVAKGQTSFPNNNSVLVNNSPFNVGQILDVRRYGREEDKETFIALPIFRDKITKDVKDSILQVINIYANRSNTNPDLRKVHESIRTQVLNNTGFDIYSPQGLESYLQQFIKTFNVDKADNNTAVEAQAKAKLPAGTPYIAFIKGGNIVVGKAGEPAYTDRDGKPKGSFFINPNAVINNAPVLNHLAKDSMLGWYEQNMSLNNYSRNKPVVLVGTDGSVNTVATSYSDYLMTKFKTNIKSYNIGTQENPNYVTNVQPIITYDLASSITEEIPSNEEVAKEMNESLSSNDVVNTSDIDDIIEQAKKDLGVNFGAKPNELFSPSVLTKEQREKISASINRIAGLTPGEQFDITDFMYNQIASVVNNDSTQVSRKEVNSLVRKAFDIIITPRKKDFEAKIAHLNNLMSIKPELSNSEIPSIIEGYKNEVSKITSIEDNFDRLQQEAYEKVAKYTGIVETKTNSLIDEEESTEDNPDTSVEEKPNEKEVDFWTDALTENPTNKLSYELRRFFGQIRNVDKKGTPIPGFLGLPTYVGSDNVIRVLMVTLADVPSDFNTMIAKLESRKEGIPWMQEVIDKLKATNEQKKNQFVTVMTNTSLRMKFTMISFDSRKNLWTTKVYDTNLNGVADSIKKEWRANFYDRNLVIVGEEGNYTLNKTKAQSLIAKFESWKGVNLKVIPTADMEPFWKDYISRVKNNNKNVVIKPTGTLLQTLKTNLVKKSDRIKFSIKGTDYQITNLGDGQFNISYLEKSTASNEEVDKWLQEFGIELQPATLEELMTKGLYHNYVQVDTGNLFYDGNNTDGLFGILYNSLKNLVEIESHDFTESGNSPLDNTVINSLANLDSKYNDTQTPFGFRDNGKSFFALTAPKFITDRTRDLKSNESVVRAQLESLSFSSPSLWLTLLKDKTFRDKFQVSHIGANAFKQLGKRLYKDNAITKLSDLDHELTKLGMFWDMLQGEVRYSNGENTFSEYPDTNVNMRMATMFSPTMSDKHLMTLVTTAVLNLRNADLLDGKGISEDVTKILYDQIVKPELKRIVKFHQNGSSTNISGYDKGAGMFLLMPFMNSIEYTPGLRLVDAIRHQPNHFTTQFIEGNEDLMKAFKAGIKQYINTLVEQKKSVWEKNGIIVSTNKGTSKEFKIVDKNYINKFVGTSEDKINMAATDFIVNSLVANANSFMTMAGDPAIYYKSKATDPITQAQDTFINVGKRLANQIAPGTSLANSKDDKYLQIFINDRVSKAGNIDYLKQILGEEEAASYTKIEGSDAQEYTTWKEHLDILAKLGKTPDTLLDITPDDIQEARELFASGVDKSKLSSRELELIGKVMQPLKPVYTGQIYDATQDVMRTVYIKSSSFPLIPQLTAGMEIDKLRLKMEELEKSSQLNVRASYQTANKVGSMKNAATIWNEDGTINQEGLDKIGKEDNFIQLDRSNFRIQQDNPFKSAKVGEDKITLGTQLMKLLFGDEIMNVNEFTYNGKVLSGMELHREYNNNFIRLVSEKKLQLFAELGLDEKGVANTTDSLTKLQSILIEEAKKRGYPLQDIQALTLDPKTGEFNLPLWASNNSNRYESMLNAIISNRMVRMKMPGNSFVAGSEEGFRVQEGIDSSINQSKIIFTSSWNGKELQAVGKNNKAQVLVSSKFKDVEGNLIDLFAKVDGQYKYITETEQGYRLKENMFDKDLLELTTFRIPTSGHQSASQVEIVGFIPSINADLMIVPKNFTKQKGLDFDNDKENAYSLWNYMNDDGSFEVLSEKHRNKILAKADTQIQALLNSDAPGDKLLAAMFDEISYTKEDIKENKVLTKLNSKITEKILQNEIIKINRAVLGSDNPIIKAKINKTLNTDYAEEQAKFIDDLINIDKENDYWTPLSDEYQKSKMFLGASGKIGTGAYSLDVVFHSLTQQAAMTGKPLSIVHEVQGQNDEPLILPKSWRFGKIESITTLGNAKTANNSRSISDVLTERQNIAVDNEKLQVMGRVNLNDLTLDVDKLMVMVGLDKGSDGNSIPFLFLSQPIIRDYVDRMKNASSNMADFDENKEQTIIDGLINKYDQGNQDIEDDDYWEKMSNSMTNENFITAIRADKPDGKLQVAVLRRFLEMRDYGIAIRGIQTSINTDSKGLGKSFFDVIQKKEALNRIGYDSKKITGASNLIGIYVPVDTLDRESKEILINNEGYTDIGEWLVKPTTLSGAFSINGVMTAYNLWSKYFPYDAVVTNKAVAEIMSVISSGEIGDTRAIMLKQDIFKNMRKYFGASKFNGIINSEDDINEERRRLYIDSEDNVSLAKYLKTIMEMTDNRAVNTFIKTNKLLNRFEFDIQKNGQPSLIKYNNAAGEEFDEQYLYESLSTLMEIRGKDNSITLPTVGNKTYTLDSLAQDLIAYSYLGNATQEAIQFTKYIPVEYLNQVGYSDKMRMATNWLNTNPAILGVKIGNEKNQHLVSEFTMQYVQHNPEKVNYKLSKKEFDKETIKIDDNSFQLKSEDTPIFISVYDSSIKKGEKKFNLYWYDGLKYTKIPVLGSFGMDEYQPRNSIGTSIVNGRDKLMITPTMNTNIIVNEDLGNNPYNINSGNIRDIFTAIGDSSSRFNQLAKKLLPHLNDVAVVIENEAPYRGAYNLGSKTIFISSNVINKSEELAETLLHEAVHDLTISELDKYATYNSIGRVSLKVDAPEHITELVRIFNNLRANVGENKITQLILSISNSPQISENDLNKVYPFTHIYEFVTMALTNREFQNYLNTIPYKQTGKTFLDKFKEVIRGILTSLGVTFDENFTAAHAISNIFEVIESPKNKPGLNNFDSPEGIPTGPVTQFTPSISFPEIKLTVPNTECN